VWLIFISITILSRKEEIIIMSSTRFNLFSCYADTPPGLLHKALKSAALLILKVSSISKRAYKAHFGACLGVVALAWEYTLQMSTEEDFV